MAISFNSMSFETIEPEVVCKIIVPSFCLSVVCDATINATLDAIRAILWGVTGNDNKKEFYSKSYSKNFKHCRETKKNKENKLQLMWTPEN